MMDEDTITIGYRDWRGEPRGKHRKGADASALGDCIDCNACVNVCPMGIDIRDGQQLECITCGLCIDACDDMMAKVGKPRGLVDYFALSDEPKERAGQPGKPVWKHILRPRTILYTSLWAAVGVGLVFALFIRSDIEVHVAPIRNPLYVTLSDGTLRNTYELRVRNKNPEEHTFEIHVSGSDELGFDLQDVDGAVFTVDPDAQRIMRFYVTAPRLSEPARSDRTDMRIWIEDKTDGDRASVATHFNGRGDE